MASTVYGHPGEPVTADTVPPIVAGVASADFGVTFEEQGLRARAELDRRPAGGE